MSIKIKFESKQEEELLKPMTHLFQFPGTQSLRNMFMSFNHWLKVPQDILEKIEEIYQLVHNGCIIMDDIEDNSTVRRQFPAAHMVYGLPMTLNAANYAWFIALDRIMKLNNKEALKVFVIRFLEMHKGQGMDFYWRENCVYPTEEEYMENLKLKISAMFVQGVELLQAFSNNKEDFYPLCIMLTVYYQLRNDYINLNSEEYQSTKSIAYEDITEGKFNFPIIYAIKHSPYSKEILQILRQRTEDIHLKKHCVSLIKATGCFEYTAKKLRELYVEIFAEIKRLGGNPEMEDIVDNVLKLRE